MRTRAEQEMPGLCTTASLSQLTHTCDQGDGRVPSLPAGPGPADSQTPSVRPGAWPHASGTLLSPDTSDPQTSSCLLALSPSTTQPHPHPASPRLCRHSRDRGPKAGPGPRTALRRLPPGTGLRTAALFWALMLSHHLAKKETSAQRKRRRGSSCSLDTMLLRMCWVCSE